MKCARSWVWFVGLSLWSVTTPAWAETSTVAAARSKTYDPNAIPPANRVAYTNINALRVNPLGLLELFTLSYRSRIMKSASPVLRDNFAGLGVAAEISPAFARIGPLLELQPLSILRLWATYQVLGYYGAFDLLQSFPSANADASDTTIKARGDLPGEDPLTNYSAGGTQLTFGANLQMKVGPIAARSQARLVRADYDLRDGDRVFYDQFYDIVVPDEGWIFTNDADLIWVSEGGLAAGLRWTVTRAFYRDRDFATGEVDLGLNPTMHRLGPIVAYTFSRKPDGAAFNTPTVLLIANWWLSHRYRTGEDVTQALPYLLLGFAFTGDLWVDAD